MQLYDFQSKGASFISEHKYVLLGDEMGLGKTIQALAALRGAEGPVLIVCPAFLRKNWSNEIEKVSSHWRDFQFEPQICKSEKDFQTLFQDDYIFIVSYDMLKKIPRDFHPEHVIFDEAHYLKNMKAGRTMLAHSLVSEHKPETCVLLSGTPIKNRVTEFYSLLRMLSYCPSDSNGLRITEKSQYAFNIKFTHPTTRTIYVRDQVRDITEFNGIRNVELLKRYLKNKYLRRLAKTVLGLPPLTTKEIQFGERMKEDKAYVEAYEKFEESGVMPTLKAELAVVKIKHTFKYAMELIEQGEPLVIFSDHVKPVSELCKLFTEKGIKCVEITGNTNPSQRETAVATFQNGGAEVLVATIGSAAVGYTMTRARNLLFNDYPWVPSDLDQARKRIHRIGQVNHCIIHMILGSKMDQYVLNKINDKRSVLRKVL